MLSYPQSFDIAVSPGMMSMRTSKSQGKGDHSRRDKYVVTIVEYDGLITHFSQSEYYQGHSQPIGPTNVIVYLLQ